MITHSDLGPLLLRVHVALAEAVDLDAQLLALMDIVADVVGAERATLFLHDKATGELYSRVGTGVQPGEIRVLDSEGVAGAVFTTGTATRISDVHADPRFSTRVDVAVGFHTHSLLAVALQTPDGLRLGVAEALNKREGDFSAEDQAALELVAGQAALVLRNTLRLEQAVHDSRREARFVEVVADIASEIQLVPLLQKIMAAVTRLLGAERSTLFLHDDKASELFTVVGEGLGSQTLRLPHDQGIAGAVFMSGHSVHIPHAYADLRFNPEIDSRTGFFTRSILCVPVVNKDGKVIGVTQVLNKRDGAFTHQDEARLRAFTAQIAIGLENARLFDDVQRMKQYNDSILASMSSAVVTLNAEGSVVTCNPAAQRILGRTPAEVVGQPAAALLGEANAWVLEKIERAAATGAPESAVDADLDVAGQPVAINLTAMPLQGAQGEPLGSMVLFDDISSEKRVRTTLARYVDAAVADQLIAADPEMLAGQRTLATLLFADIQSFTPLSEQLGPHATVALLNDYLTRMMACIEAEGGTVDKFVGDEIMAVFGVPYARDDDADRAVRAAIAMQRALALMSAERALAGQPALVARIGINTGEVFSGNIGSSRRMDFTVMGDGVNLASRLESVNRYYGTLVLISEFTLRALRATYRTREVDRVVVKGKSEAVAVHEVLDHFDEARFPNMIDGLASYRDGLALYRMQRWADAITAFEKAGALNPGDRLPPVYVARCQQLRQQPPIADWDGVWRMTEK
jgi:adenylate cyclase